MRDAYRDGTPMLKVLAVLAWWVSAASSHQQQPFYVYTPPAPKQHHVQGVQPVALQVHGVQLYPVQAAAAAAPATVGVGAVQYPDGAAVPATVGTVQYPAVPATVGTVQYPAVPATVGAAQYPAVPAAVGAAQYPAAAPLYPAGAPVTVATAQYPAAAAVPAYSTPVVAPAAAPAAAVQPVVIPYAASATSTATVHGGTPFKLLFSRFPPLLEGFVQRMQNYFSTYNHPTTPENGGFDFESAGGGGVGDVASGGYSYEPPARNPFNYPIRPRTFRPNQPQGGRGGYFYNRR
ncbi:ice-structuring glycoprotein-like [Schistocerca cancellata]|uniref:ice-structuring glycoprotein-like n=1 Tax=Schistocerca cancellata TaxID=274614 RepID=UPI0021187433|nr:ice-structuring glycoprotein-like [Schistocerca cancellata]